MAEDMELMEKRHKQESRELEGKVRALLKTAKKSNKAVIEAEAIQMGFDLKARHREEFNNIPDLEALNLENEIGALKSTVHFSIPDDALVDVDETKNTDEDIALMKRAKAQKKKDKKSSKEVERQQKKEEINSNAGPSLREEELIKINELLLKEDLEVKLVASDGHCLYRAIADQLDSLWLLDADTKSNKKHDFISLRLLAGEYLRVHAEEFAPFLGLLPSDSDYEEYCRKVTSVGDAEWGGQLEIKALCSCLNRTMLIFSADSPVLKMGDEEGKDCFKIPLKLAYHRHFYALGEHYNSVAPVIKPCSCSIDEHTTP